MNPSNLLHELFEESVKQTPNALSVYTKHHVFSYAQLAKQVNDHAQSLIQLKNKSKLIAIVMDKGWEQIVAVLSILKSGFAYLPIDPSESKERLTHLLNITNVTMILIQERYKNHGWPIP